MFNKSKFDKEKKDKPKLHEHLAMYDIRGRISLTDAVSKVLIGNSMLKSELLIIKTFFNNINETTIIEKKPA